MPKSRPRRAHERNEVIAVFVQNPALVFKPMIYNAPWTLSRAPSKHYGIIHTGKPSARCPSLFSMAGAVLTTHLLGRLVLTLTIAIWQFSTLNFGLPESSCDSLFFAVMFATSEISILPPMKLCRAKFSQVQACSGFGSRRPAPRPLGD